MSPRTTTLVAFVLGALVVAILSFLVRGRYEYSTVGSNIIEIDHLRRSAVKCGFSVTNIQQFRESYPQYDGVSDRDIAQRLYERFEQYSRAYSLEEFTQRLSSEIGVQAPDDCASVVFVQP